jgi:hypothetical protein
VLGLVNQSRELLKLLGGKLGKVQSAIDGNGASIRPAVFDRLFQLELWRRQATGTMAEIMGRKERKRDLANRLFM